MEKRTVSEDSVANNSSSSRGILRRVNFDDYEAVMSIRENVYDGTDYLPAMFYVYLQSKHHVSYIYEEDGKAVAFVIYYLHSDDDSLVTAMAGRVSQSSQNQGYVNILMSAHTKLSEKLNQVFYSSLLKPNIQKILHRWRVCDTTNILAYKLSDRMKIQRFIRSGSSDRSSSSSSEPLSCSFSEGIKWLDSTDQLIRFVYGYSRDFIGIGPVWQTIRVNRSGLRNVFSVSKSFVTFAEPEDQKTRSEQQTGAHVGWEDRRLVAFSFSSALPCKLGVIVGVNFYGDDCDVMISHLAKHLRHYEAVTSDDVTLFCVIHFPLTIEDAVVQQRLMDDFGPRFVGDHFTVTKVLHYIVPTPKSKL